MEDYLIRILQLSKEGLSCSQLLMQLALEARSESNPSLVRAMGGLAYGCGTGQGNCGVLTGGCCVLALYAGDKPNESEKLHLMLAELNEWFTERITARYSGINCEAIVGVDGPAASRKKCGSILIETYGKVLAILSGYGFTE